MANSALFKLENLSARASIGIDQGRFTLTERGVRVESSRGPVAFRILAVTPGKIEVTPDATIDEILIHVQLDGRGMGPLNLPPGATMSVSIGNEPPQIYTDMNTMWAG